ncbi:TetR/AcrR family transcriptional regulator [Dietzia natronolimnaea]|uniref:TetR/AcrR family transcriptional regulator n=1 Tax=Dietzia natronolimnaea TaxID=161920 RepID=UPI0015FA680B|nr:TetR/AcrR family transcriptional regulator [Dietzia natronolimnaea]MBB1037687.1 TetR/AcrR family transcriptional regulator [Dietzia natronolimnaea]
MTSEVTADRERPTELATQNAELNEFLEALFRWTDAAPRAAPVYQRGLETRAHIVASARRVFILLGYADCTVEDILNEASISRGTFYSHFRSKKAVFAAAVEIHIAERIHQTNVTDTDDPGYRDRVRATVHRFLTNYANDQDFSMVLEQAAHDDPGFRLVRLVIRDIFVGRISRGIDRQQKLGTASVERSPETLAMTILSMMTNVAQVEIGWRKRKPDEEMVETLTHFWCEGIGLK